MTEKKRLNVKKLNSLELIEIEFKNFLKTEIKSCFLFRYFKQIRPKNILHFEIENKIFSFVQMFLPHINICSSLIYCY